jgi:hypothetical protein
MLGHWSDFGNWKSCWGNDGLTEPDFGQFQVVQQVLQQITGDGFHVGRPAEINDTG